MYLYSSGQSLDTAGRAENKTTFQQCLQEIYTCGHLFGGLPAGSHHEIFTAATYPILLGCILFLIASELTSADFGQV